MNMIKDVPMSDFARTIMHQKYSQQLADGLEGWGNISYRVTKHVMKAIGYNMRDKLSQDICKAITERKFIPAGRYLYACGRPRKQVCNCFEGATEFITRQGVKTLKELSGQETMVLTSNSKWAPAEITSFGRQHLMKVTLRRFAETKEIFATPGHSWRVYKDSNKTSVDTQDLLPGDKLCSIYGYGLKRTPISPIGVMHGIVFGDGCVPKTKMGFNMAQVRLCGNKKHLATYFQQYPNNKVYDDTEDIKVASLPRHFKDHPSLKWDRSYLYGWLAGYIATDGSVNKGGGCTISSSSRRDLEVVRDIACLLGVGVCSIRDASGPSNYVAGIRSKYTLTFVKGTLTSDLFLLPKHRDRFDGTPSKRKADWKVLSVETTSRYETVYCATVPGTNEFTLAGNILVGNCVATGVADSREGWAELLHNGALALMTGAGVGVNYSDIRSEGTRIRGTGGFATGPIALIQMVNECGRGVIMGGSRRAALWAGLRWDHPDIHKFITVKDWSKEVRKLKGLDYNFPATLDQTNISVCLNDEFFAAYPDPDHSKHALANSVFWAVITRSLKTGEPGFSVDTGRNRLEIFRNPCCEFTSTVPDNICCLGSINLARVDSIEELENLVEMGMVYLLAGTVYSDLPYPGVSKAQEKTRQLGLGLMGVHEWLLKRGKLYAPDHDLWQWLEVYQKSTKFAREWADELGLSRPIKTRAIAPTGSIGIIAETTGGIEPIFCKAYKRRYLKGSTWNHQYVIDPTAKRLVEQGLDVEDAYDISPERRVEFQAWMQQSVDMAISSTVNLPQWGSKQNNAKTVQDFGNMLMKYLPELRGITVYPDGARDGQPLTPVPYTEAMKHVGKELVEEAADICDITKGGSCGD